MKPDLNAAIVSVQYGDLLGITAAYNRHHFNRVVVATTPDDLLTRQVAEWLDLDLVVTDSFYQQGAVFNKWRGLNEAIVSALTGIPDGSRLVVMDADVLWPKSIAWEPYGSTWLQTPRRRICADFTGQVPAEEHWSEYPLFRPDEEFAGYTQIINPQDPVFIKQPFYEDNWRHAGGADTFFARRWSQSNLVRPPFEVLHLGPVGKNWCGRVTPMLDGTVPPEAEARKAALEQFMRSRDRRSQYRNEKL